jgi:hydroxypyruvate reductase
MKDLAQLRTDARTLFYSGVRAADPKNAVQRWVQVTGQKLVIQDTVYDLTRYDSVYVLGAGKAAAAMAQAVEARLGPWLTGGIVNVKYGQSIPLKRIEVNEAGHPIPDEAGIRGTDQMIKLLKGTGEKDLVLFLVSGGGSALLPCPAEGLNLADKQKVTQLLLECGATIHEINAVRKHLSLIKGGRMARLAYPSTLVSLILSDVIGDDIDCIASGPTAPDKSTFSDCIRIIENHGIRHPMPLAVMAILERGERGELEETPKENDTVFNKTHNVIIGNNFLALDTARQKADELGYHCLILSTSFQGETKDAAKVHAALAKEILSTDRPVPRPACVISGGETTVVIKGDGLGGRNQEFALAAAMDIEGLEPVVILSGGTDGTDGPTDAAGALADGRTIARARESGMEANTYLDRNDSYHFFQALDDLLVTGPTHTNVMDLRLVLVG